METRGPTRRGISSRKGIDYFVAIIAALLIGLATIVSVPTASYARVTSDDPSGEGRVGLYLQRDSINRMWLGTQVPSPSSDGWPTFCVQMALAIETSTQVSVTNVPEATPFVEGLELTTPQAAYLLEKYSNTTDSTTAAAIALLVHVNFQQDVYGSNNFAAVNVPAEDAAQWVIGMVRSTAPYVETRAQELREEAINSGVIGYDSGVITGDGERSGSVNMIGATDEAGNYLPGVDVTLTLNGPAIFDETGTDTWSGTTQETPLSLPWSATGNGDVSVSAVYLASPTTIALLNPHNHSQKRITYGGQKLVEHYADTVWFKVLYSFQPVGVSSVVEVTDTGEFTDYFTAYADPEFGPGTWLTDDAGNNIPVTYRVSAYVAGDSPPTLSQQVPDTAELVGQQQVTATGPSELSATFVAPAPGFYTVVWEVAEEDQATDTADYIAGPWVDGYGIAEETVSYRHMIEISTAATSRVREEGTFLVDDVWVSGFPADHGDFQGDERFAPDTADIVLSLYFFPEGEEVTDENTDAAEFIAMTTFPARNGYYPEVASPEFKALVDDAGELIGGTYVFVTSFAGDDRVQPYSSSFEDSAEQVVITPPAAPTPPASSSLPSLAKTGVAGSTLIGLAGVFIVSGLLMLRRPEESE